MLTPTWNTCSKHRSPARSHRADSANLGVEDDLKAYATKDDLKAFEARANATFAAKDELQALAAKVDEGFAEARRFAMMLYEDLVERIKILGKGRRKRR